MDQPSEALAAILSLGVLVVIFCTGVCVYLRAGGFEEYGTLAARGIFLTVVLLSLAFASHG